MKTPSLSKITSWTLFFLSKFGRTPKWQGSVTEEPWLGTLEEGKKIYRGEFAFWDEEIHFSTPFFWQHPGLSLGFLAFLHGFEWLRSLRALPIAEARGVARHYINDWIETNQSWHPTTWSADITGQRLASWVGTFDFFGSSADDDFLHLFEKNVSRQVRYLEKKINLTKPRDLDLQALKGLILSKLALGLSPTRAVEKLEQYLHIQMYADGSHRSRAPMAQLMVLRDLLDIRLSLRERQIPLPQGLQATIHKLAMVVRFFRHGDGGLGVFWGSFEGTPALIDMILSHADVRSKKTEQLHEGGFYRVTQGKGLLLVDVGSPLINPTLAQDRLGFEYSFGGTRLISNGTRPLQITSQMQQAETTTQISGTALFFDHNNRLITEPSPPPEMNCNLWTMDDELSPIVSAEWEQRLGPHKLRHQRTLSILGQGTELRGEEALTGPQDGAALIRLTFHPTLSATIRKDSSTLIITAPDGLKWRLSADRTLDLGLHRGYYYGIDNHELFCPQAVMKVPLEDKTTLIKWTLRLLEL